MGFWRAFEPAEVAADFARIASCGFDSVRLFLLWEDFQPAPDRVDLGMVARLVSTLELASAAGLAVMPTLFTGHMSGVNWIPPWALGGAAGDARFRVVSAGRVVTSGLASWYDDAAIWRAQVLQAREVAGAVAGHPALWAWDLGNESSNCVIPASTTLARDWLLRVTDALRGADDQVPITVGLHMEDLEQDRRLGPREAAEACDFLTMHGYPGYAPWAAGPTDERLLPFLMRVTRWLGGGADVLFSELGVPTRHGADRDDERPPADVVPALVSEQEAASYLHRALEALVASGSTGAMLWCHADYAEEIWIRPPLDLAIHERSFGIWRADGSEKPAAGAARTFARAHHRARAPEQISDLWIDLDAEHFSRAPSLELPRLYRRYCAALRDPSATSAELNPLR